MSSSSLRQRHQTQGEAIAQQRAEIQRAHEEEMAKQRDELRRQADELTRHKEQLQRNRTVRIVRFVGNPRVVRAEDTNVTG